MEKNVSQVTAQEETALKARGYNEDLLPSSPKQRTMGARNFFTLWMGSIHNIPNYAAVGGFIFLGLSPLQVMLAVVLSSFIVATFMNLNGVAGSKYGIPFAMHLQSTYGSLGAKLPGFLRGCVAAIAWFGLQTFTGSLALLIILGKFWPNFLEIGGSFQFFGLRLPELMAFTLFWLLNVAIGFGGSKILNRFTAILSPLIYVVIIGLTIWAIRAGGGLTPILSYQVSGAIRSVNPLVAYLIIFNSVVAVWSAPGASVADFTKNARSTRAQVVGQTTGLVVGYGIFAFSSVVILLGGSLYFGIQEWNILNIIDRLDNVAVVVLAMSVFLLTTISTNATGNIIPAGYQLAALFPKKMTYKKGVMIASVISFLIMPWKLMENADSIFIFLNAIGAVLGPVAGVMIANYYFVQKQQIDLNALYVDKHKKEEANPFYGLNKPAYVATILALVLSLSGQFILQVKIIADISWFVGFATGFVLYLVLKKWTWDSKKVKETAYQEGK